MFARAPVGFSRPAFATNFQLVVWEDLAISFSQPASAGLFRCSNAPQEA
jgi:hypothetical protein